jgi:hypothetical protein
VVVVAALAASAEGSPLGRGNQINMASHEIDGQRWQPIIVPVAPAIFDQYVLPFDVAGFFESLMERG